MDSETCLWTEVRDEVRGGHYTTACYEEPMPYETESYGYCPWCGKPVERYTFAMQAADSLYDYDEGARDD